MYKTAIEEMSIEDKVKEIQSKENYTKISELPQMYINAVISVEDHIFYTRKENRKKNCRSIYGI